ncbi:MAG: TldD/PmbA family protein, partial [Pseudoxanthomonas sp.]
MHRRDFLAISGLSLGGLLVPSFLGKAIAAEQLQTTLDVGFKKGLADAALAAATDSGASYCDVRVGRYLRQFVITR